MAKLYPGIAFSPPTTLTENIGAADTIIRVADASVFPPAPNYATIGTDEDGETIEYAAKADGLLSGCTRGVEGAAKAWRAGEVIARNFTAADHNGMITAVTTAQQTAEAAQQTADNCLPLSGGVMTGPIKTRNTGSSIVSSDDNGYFLLHSVNGCPNLFVRNDNFDGSSPVRFAGIDSPQFNNDAANKRYVDSHIINPNLLDDAYFVNPVNQRGLTTYQGEGYTIDRWYIYAGRLDIISGSHIKITRNNMTDYFDLRQSLEGLDKDLVYTLSILSDGELYSVTGAFVSNPVTKTPFGEIMLSWSGGELNIVVIRPLTTDPVNITAAKLELGHIQTLAHQENGVWVLNEIPNYALELAKCQRYQLVFHGEYEPVGLGQATNSTEVKIYVPLPVTLRAKPSILGNLIARNQNGFISTTEIVSETLSCNYLRLSAHGSFASGNIYEFFTNSSDDFIIDANL